ncbi:MAG: hypothetical protein JST47_01350 [Bacteroidetes bacterium]|nr:hypothetical protein [Bacteroidota bacterium]MBS1973981.1 hypothetical protein [Bacteroidota bacterium]
MILSNVAKLLFIGLVLFLTTTTLTAQKLMHGFGLTISALQGTLHEGSGYESFSVEQNNLTYFPRYNFVENENSSISIGAPIGIGLGIASNTFGNDAGVIFSYDLPIVIDYNIGCKSTMENESSFGGYFGAGFGYNKVNISRSSYSDFDGSSYGPLFRAGVRFGSANESWHGHGVTVGAFYKMGLEKDKLHTIGLNVLFDL